MEPSGSAQHGTTNATRLSRWDRIRFAFNDHAYLRHWWTNFDQVADGVYRSNYPGPGRLHRMRKMGIKTVLTLRGGAPAFHYELERERCAAAGLTLHSIAMSARSAPPREVLQRLIGLFRSMEKPFVMHCKSGADRAGLASAVYLLVIEGRSLAEARQQLSFKYFHLKSTKTGILDRFLDHFEPYEGQMDFETWLDTTYDPAALKQDFGHRRF